MNCRADWSDFRAVTDRPTKVTLRLDNLPDYGYLNYRVLNKVQQAEICWPLLCTRSPRFLHPLLSPVKLTKLELFLYA